MNKEKYIHLVEEHRRILKKSRKIIETIFDRITENVEREGSDTSTIKSSEDYETEVNIVNKLSSILLKIMKQEQEIAQIDLEKLKESESQKVDMNAPITEEEVEMMEQYVKGYREKQLNSGTPLSP